MVSAVFGNFPIPNQTGDQFVSKAATTAISALFKQTARLEVIVRAEPVAKLLQGSLDGFDFNGKNLLMYSGLRVESMDFSLQAVSIDFGAIFKGQVQLKQPTQARMRIALSEEDLNASFNTPFLVEKMQQVQHQGQPLRFQSTQFTLNADKSVRLQSAIRVGENDPVEIDVTARLQVADRRKIQFVEVTYGNSESEQGLSQTLINHLNDLLDLDQFALDGMQLRVDNLRVQNKKLIFYGIAHVNHFPRRRGNVAAA